MINNMDLYDLIEGTVFTIALIFFLGGIAITYLIFVRKKKATNLIQIILFTVGYLYSLGEVLENFTTWYEANRFGEFFTIFLSMIILVVSVTAFFEYKLSESEQELYILNKELEKKIEERTKDLRASEENYRNLVKKLKEIDQIRSDFVRRTSHELKTPLISIYTSSQYLLDSYKEELNEDILKLVKVINRGGNRLKNLVENLLDVYDLESKKIKLNKQRNNLTQTLKECINDFDLLFKERDLFLKTDLEEDVYIDIDMIRIEHVILNLLSNAIKNTPPNGIIYVGLNKDKSYIDILIKDTGIGFTEAERDIAFKKFGKIERKIQGKDIITEGSGLGLYISKEVVILHEGKIWLESEGRDKGSTFIIRLPINEEEIPI